MPGNNIRIELKPGRPMEEAKNRSSEKSTEKAARGEFIGERRHEMNKVCKSGWKPKLGCA